MAPYRSVSQTEGAQHSSVIRTLLQSRARLDTLMVGLILAWSILALPVSVFRGARHDYVAYLRQWSLVSDGENPWGAGNTYGPLHVTLAYLAELGPLVPKLFMVVAFLSTNLLLAAALLKSRPQTRSWLAYLIFVPFNFLVISIVISFGLNDALAAALVGLAVLARFRGRLVAAGVLLGLAVLLKFYPALLLPFFCLDGRKFNSKLFLTTSCTTFVGFVLSLAIWGNGFITSFVSGASRDPKLLSLLSAFRNHPELGGDSSVVDFLVNFNSIFVLVGCAVLLAVAYKIELTWIEGAALAGFTYPLIYKVGHPQFYIASLFLFVGLLILGTPRARQLAYCFIPFVLFLSIFQFGYEVLTDRYREIGGSVRRNVGFISFALGITTIAVSLAAVSRNTVGALKSRLAGRALEPDVEVTTKSGIA
jgi:hypothetical protein